MLNRLCNILETYNYYDMIDYNTSISDIEKVLIEDPKTVINMLLDIIEDIQE